MSRQTSSNSIGCAFRVSGRLRKRYQRAFTRGDDTLLPVVVRPLVPTVKGTDWSHMASNLAEFGFIASPSNPLHYRVPPRALKAFFAVKGPAPRFHVDLNMSAQWVPVAAVA